MGTGRARVGCAVAAPTAPKSAASSVANTAQTQSQQKVVTAVAMVSAEQRAMVWGEWWKRRAGPSDSGRGFDPGAREAWSRRITARPEPEELA